MAQKNRSPVIAVNRFSRGRVVYFTGSRFPAQNSRQQSAGVSASGSSPGKEA